MSISEPLLENLHSGLLGYFSQDEKRLVGLEMNINFYIPVGI